MKDRDLRQSKEYRNYMKRLGWQTEKGVFLKMCGGIRVSFVKYQRPDWPIDFKNVEKVIKKKGLVFTKIEPRAIKREKFKEIEKEMKKNGFKKDMSPMLPTKTSWLDLKKSEKELFRKMHYKTRYNIRKCQSFDLEFKTIRGDKVKQKELKCFYKIYKANSKKKRFWGIGFNQLKWLVTSFGKKCYLLTVKNLGGLLILLTDKTAYYSHNGSTLEGKKYHVPTLLAWKAVLLAKKSKKEIFDFEGVADERFRVTKKWSGFSRFKKSFGGDTIEYVGSFSKKGINL